MPVFTYLGLSEEQKAVMLEACVKAIVCKTKIDRTAEHGVVRRQELELKLERKRREEEIKASIESMSEYRQIGRYTFERGQMVDVDERDADVIRKLRTIGKDGSFKEGVAILNTEDHTVPDDDPRLDEEGKIKVPDVLPETQHPDFSGMAYHAEPKPKPEPVPEVFTIDTRPLAVNNKGIGKKR